MRFSVIIPTCNRPGLLDECLTSIEALNYPRTGFEVLVVDDGSDPPPDEVIKRHAQLLPLRYYRHKRQGPARTRNCGLSHALAEYVVFTDDDCKPHEDWLRAFDHAFTEHPAAGLGGTIVSDSENTLFGNTSQLLVTFLYEYGETGDGHLRFFCSNNLAFPRQKLLQTGGFEEAFPLAAAEDRDICAKWISHGELRFASSAIVRHRQILDFVSFTAQHYRYGRGAFQFWSRRRADGYAGNRVASWRFYWKMLRYPFAHTSIPRALAMSTLLVVSQLACAAGYFSERRKTPILRA
jgi:glycosyltransferase involved in cell wall biosynthesis